MSKIAVIGMVGNSAFMPVNRFPISGETVKAEKVHFEPGGKGFNQAVAAARCGAEVSFLGAVGEEGFESIRDFSAAEKMQAVLVRKPGQTAYATIITDREGNNCVTVYQGPSLAQEDVEAFAENIRRADILLLNNEVPETVNVRAVEIAKGCGIKVILNPAPSRPICEYLLENTDLLTPNEHELAGLEHKADLLVTLGEKGCLIKGTGKVIPAVHIGQVVDTTGAGDTFNGVLAVKLAEGTDLEMAARYANVASGISVTRPYAATAIPGKAEIEKHI